MSVNNVVNGELEQVAGEASVENSYESTSIVKALSAYLTNKIKKGLCGAVGGDMFDYDKTYTGGDMFIYGNKVYRVKDGQGMHGGVVPSIVEEISLKSLNQTLATTLDSLNWKLSNAGGSASGVVFSMPTSAKEYLIIASGDGHIYSINIPNASLVGYVGVSGLNPNVINVYVNGDGAGKGATSGYTYYCYYR